MNLGAIFDAGIFPLGFMAIIMIPYTYDEPESSDLPLRRGLRTCSRFSARCVKKYGAKGGVKSEL